ncbi:MAG TPA: hypothetical protein VFG51_03735 [Candidatus Saccharimonadia bacterium]|nr:hypothetical protein [Candidatus Saccharimonadia bacterium]
MTQFAQKHPWIFAIILAIPYFLFTIYSYSQTDPNLVITQNPLYWNFQLQMWQLGYHMRDLSAQLYAGLIVVAFGVYAVAVRMIRRAGKRTGAAVLGIALFVLLFSYPALSHDLFNYMFNARMVVKYQMNPHQHTAMEFRSVDSWVRFMNNIDTAAPYGYGWTALSLVPYVAGLDHFNTIFYAFKLFMIGGFIALFFVDGALAKELGDADFESRKWLYFLNPLILLEGIATVHNDVWMMLPFFASILLLMRARKHTSLFTRAGQIFISLALFMFSASIKFATLVAAPIYVGLLFSGQLPKKISAILRNYWADFCSILLFLPLLTDRSQQFHPWYLFWSLSFLPFIRSKLLRLAFIALSFSSLLRYLPYLSLGGYNAIELSHEKLITWGGGLALFVLFFLASKLEFIKRRMLE